MLQQASLEPLCEMVQVVHGEVLQEGVRRSAECAALEGLLERLLQDLQERLIFRFQTFLRDGIRSFRPSPQDIDYPARLGSAASPGSADPEAHHLEAHPAAHRGWYPTLPRALGCMARVYRCVPRAVFEGLAQEAVKP